MAESSATTAAAAGAAAAASGAASMLTEGPLDSGQSEQGISAGCGSSPDWCDDAGGLVLCVTDLQVRPSSASGGVNNQHHNNNHLPPVCGGGHEVAQDTCQNKLCVQSVICYSSCDTTGAIMGQAGHRPVCLATDFAQINAVDGNSQAKPRAPDVDALANPAALRLEKELQHAQQQLQLKEQEVVKLSKIRDEVESELHDLTASLFQEAHKMVQEANMKAASAEKSLVEADMKIDGLETEVAALKTLVLTSTPSQPNRHLHPHLDSHRRYSSTTARKSCSPSSSPICSEEAKKAAAAANGGHPRVIGAAGLLGAKAEDLVSGDYGCCCNSSACSVSPADPERFIDPMLRKEFTAWKKAPNLMQKESDFLQRLYREDIDLCLQFPNSQLTGMLKQAVELNALCINPLLAKSPEQNLPQTCALFQAPMLCRFHVTLQLSPDSNPPDAGPQPRACHEFSICQLARNRIIAVCDCLNYLRYIEQGLVKSHVNDVYWEVMQHRRKMTLARLGFTPD